MHAVGRWRLAFRSQRLARLRVHFLPEHLESRHLLSTATLSPLADIAGIVATPNTSATPDRHRGGGGGGGGTPTPTPTPTPSPSPTQNQPPPASALTPSQVSNAYGYSLLSGLTGAGVTIAIVDAYGAPNIQSDLTAFDKQFNLPAANLKIVGQTGGSTLPAADAGWSLETSLDVEWAHAIAPGANIVLVQASSANLSDLVTAIQYASAHANVVSMSWGAAEFAGETSYDSLFSTPGVTFVASSGDTGGISGSNWPSVSPNVLAVGGTTLTTSSTGSYVGETAWSGVFSGSGGGVSTIESLPAYQSQVLGQTATGRVTPDVSYNANPSTGFAVYDSYATQGQAGWFQVGGTSAGTPQWAATVALADQLRGASLSSQQTLTALYAQTSTLSTSFHDVTKGYNAFYLAGPGYDAVTGLGSPIANVLVPKLAGKSAPAVVAATTTSTGSTTPMGPLANSHSPNLPPSSTPNDIVVTVPVVVTVPAGAGRVQQVILFVTITTPTPPPPPPPAPAPSSSLLLVAQSPPQAPSPVAQSLTLSTTVGSLLSADYERSSSATRAPVPDLIRDTDTLPEAPAPAPAPAPDDAPPAVPLSVLMRTWDAALAAYVAEEDAAALPPIPKPTDTQVEEDPASTLETALMAGGALALWGTWEARSRFSDRRRKVWLPDEPSLN